MKKNLLLFFSVFLLWTNFSAAQTNYFLIGDITGGWDCEKDTVRMYGDTVRMKDAVGGPYEFLVLKAEGSAKPTFDGALGFEEVDPEGSAEGYERGTANHIKVFLTKPELYVAVSSDMIIVRGQFGTVVINSWTVAGDKALMGVSWDPAETANDMIQNVETGVWSLEKKNVALSADTYGYKVAANNIWGVADYPETESAKVTITENGTYDLTFTWKCTSSTSPISGELSCDAEKKEDPTFTLTENMTQAELTAMKGKTGKVTLERTFYKDGGNNTLCLPFSLDADKLAESPLAGYFKLQKFTSATVQNKGLDTQTLMLGMEDATEIEAGVPYIIVWNSGEDLVDPEFSSVTITEDVAGSITHDNCSCKGTFIPKNVSVGKDVMFVGNDGKLYWPEEAGTINGFRCYFTVDLTAATKGMNAVLIEKTE